MDNSTASSIETKTLRIGALDGSDGVRTGLLVSLAGISILASEVIQHVTSRETVWGGLLLFVVGLFIANFSRMFQIWTELRPIFEAKPAERSQSQRRKARQGFRELFFYLFLVLGFSTALAFLSGNTSITWLAGLQLHAEAAEQGQSLQIRFLLLTIAFGFVPLIVGFCLQANVDQNYHNRQLFYGKSISVPSFYYGSAILLGIIALATWAARVSSNQQEEMGANLTFWITIGVVALFGLFIVLPHAQRWIDNWADRESMKITKQATPLTVSALPTLFSWIDSAFVRILAPLTGATQNGPLVPHSFVVFSLLPLTALGFVLPQPWGLFPIFLGMLMILALGRRWAWIEEDRETASRLLKTDSPEIQVGFDNDLKDEALLGYAALFILVPLALHQINGVVEVFAGKDGGEIADPFFAWISFFGGELAKAVPFVDWWEIYNVKIDTPIAGVCADNVENCVLNGVPGDMNPLAKHLTFASRAMVDLVIMAALLQAIGIWQRSRAQQKLYNSGQIDSFDPFTEEHFFKHGMRNTRPSSKFEERIEKYMEQRSKLNLALVPYNETRLGELLDHHDAEVRAGAEWMIGAYPVLVGTPERKLQQLVSQWDKVWKEGNPTTPPVSKLNIVEQRAWRRNEKLRVEALLEELIDRDQERVPKELSDHAVDNLIRLIVHFGSHEEFQYARIVTVDLLAQIHQTKAFWGLAAQVCPEGDSNPEKEIQNQISASLSADIGGEGRTWVGVRYGRQEMRVLCYRAMVEYSNMFEPNDLLLETIRSFLDRMKGLEVGEAARTALNSARRRI